MHSLRKWFYKPKKEDSSKLALFYWADEELTMVATELDSFDGRTDPDRCSILVSQLRLCQDKVLNICNDIMNEAIPDMRANRDFRAKFPDDVLHENLAGQLWFGAECLAAGSNIIHRETESASMRPLAKALTRALDNVRCLLREQCLKNALIYSEKVREALRIFDRLFAEFELCYVSAMVPIKSAKEYHLQQEIIVLFSETLIRALKLGLVTQEMIDDYDPSIMFTIPRLAIVWGLLLYPDGPFKVEKDSGDVSELFRPFCKLLFKIRDLLWTLTDSELHTLEKMLCSQDEPEIEEKSNEELPLNTSDDCICKFHQNHLNCKQFIHDFYAYNFGIMVPEGTRNPEDPPKSDSNKNFDLVSDYDDFCNQNTQSRCSDDFRTSDFHHGKAKQADYCDTPLNSTSSLEGQLSRLHDDCTCGISASMREHLTPSRELMRQVMRRVEIVPPGQHVTGYGSSPETSPRAYHHGLLSHSFPLNSEPDHGVAGKPKVRRRRTRSGRRTSRCCAVDGENNLRVQSREPYWGPGSFYSTPLVIPRVQDLRQDEGTMNSEATYSSCSSCQSVSSVSSPEWDSTSPETSSYNSECQDDEEIALALQAAEIASRNKARSKFKSSRDLLHKLFVCISGVADQLQTNYASDLRNMLKSVFDMNCTQNHQPETTPDECQSESADVFSAEDGLMTGHVVTGALLNDNSRDDDDRDRSSVDSAEEAVPDNSPTQSLVISDVVQHNEDNGNYTGPPEWMPDELSSECMSCTMQFTILRRRHHCRNCGKIFCSRCSSNSIPLPRYGHLKPVRVCNQCFMFQLTNLVMQRQL